MPLLWQSVLLFFVLFIFKVTNSIVEAKYKVKDGRTTSTTSSTLGSTAETSYLEVFQFSVSLGFIYAIQLIRYRRPYLLAMILVLVSNVMIVFKFFRD